MRVSTLGDPGGWAGSIAAVVGSQEDCQSFLDCLEAGQFVRAVDQLQIPWQRIVGVILVLVIGWYLSKVVVRMFGRSIARRFDRPSVTRTILRTIRLSIFAVAVVVAAAVAGLRIGDLLISVTVISAVVAVTLAPIVSSIISGLFVLADQPYEIGDMIELADRGQIGFVEDITLRYTKMFTLDNTFIVIPNSTIRDRDVVNYSAEDERTRLSLPVLVTYESDVQAARNLIERAARDVESVIDGGPDIRIGSARYPAGPTCYIDEFADHGILLTLRYWAKEPYKLLTVRSKVQTEVRERLAGADVEIAYPHSHLVFDETSGQASVRLEDGGGPDTRGWPGDDSGGKRGESPGTEPGRGRGRDPSGSGRPDGGVGRPRDARDASSRRRDPP